MERWTVFSAGDRERKRPLACIKAGSAAEAHRIGEHKFETSSVQIARGCEPVSVAGVATVLGIFVGIPALLVFAWKKSK